MNDLSAADRQALDSIVSELAQAWNAGDAARFAAVFAEDAQQVNIYGQPLIGRQEILDRHDRIFKSIFQASTNTLQIVGARYVSSGVILARISSEVQVPQGPLQGVLQTLGSLVLRKAGESWQIVLFHNTRVSV